jgi:hypothetical protein
MGSSSEDTPGIPAKSEELLDILRKGKTFAEELLRENERLRLKIVRLENEGMDAARDAESDRLRAENARLQARLDLYERRFADVESENQDFARRYLEVAEHNEALANLYVASYQLHSTLDPDEVVAAVVDIVSGLVGASEFALFLAGGAGGDLAIAASEGVEDRFPDGRLPGPDGLERRVAATREAYFGDPAGPDAQVACMPLVLKDECVGLIAIYRILSQKGGAFTAVDHELLNLLAGQAASALVASRLFAAGAAGAAGRLSNSQKER